MKFLAMAATATALCATETLANPEFATFVPGGNNVKGVKAVGHNDPHGGGGLNPFGLDFSAALTKWTAELCYKDSDGDGQFNGAELGDPCCEWVRGSHERLAYTTATAPGDKTSKQDPKIWAAVKCADGSSPEAKYMALTGKTVGSGSTNGAPGSVVGDKNGTTTATPTPTPSSRATELASVLAVVTVATAALLA